MGDAPNDDLLSDATLQWFHDYADEGMFTTDRDLRIRSWNRWLVAATGLSEAQVVGRLVTEVLPSFVERGFQDYYARALERRVTLLSYSLHRFILPGRPDRTPMQPSPQSGRIGPLAVGGDVVGTITLIEDVSERVATERELRSQIAGADAARRTAEAASRVKDEFLATLSHELRTPLNAVLGWTRILLARPLDASTIRAVEVIDRNASAQLTLIADMLDMSRITTGKLRMEAGVVDLSTVVLSAIDVIQPGAEAKGVRIVTDMAAQLPPVTGDTDRLVQVVWNVLSNAVKFTPPGGTVSIRLTADSGFAVLAVADTGEGIDPAFLPHVFERFRQADPSASRRHGGLGLGLALVRELVQLHGGTVDIASEGLGRGTVVTVSLPARAEGLASTAARSVSHGSLADLAGIRVLVVEDEDDSREIIARSVGEFGADVTAVSSSAEALAFLRAQPEAGLPHVILSDIGMPDQDGYEFIDALRKLPSQHGGRVPAIAVTAYATPQDRKHVLSAGFELHVEKPVSPLALAAAIARVTSGAARDS